MIENLINNLAIKFMIKQGDKALLEMQKNSYNTKDVYEKTLMQIIKDNANTEYGKKYDFKSIKNLEDYKSKVPVTDYDDYKEYIHQMMYENKSQLLTNYEIVGYAITSGSTGKSKFIPLTNLLLEPFKNYTITRALALADKAIYKKQHKHIKPGKGLNAINCPLTFLPNGIPYGDISQHAALKYEKLFSYIVASPVNRFYNSEHIDVRYANLRWALEDSNVLYSFADFFNQHSDRIGYLKQNWKMLVNDIEKGQIDDSVYVNEKYRDEFSKKLKPNKKRADFLRKEFEKGFTSDIIKRIWPNMAVWTGIGTATFERSLNEVKKYLGHIPCDLSIYGGSEGLYGVVYELENKKVQLLPDSVFLEFRSLDADAKIYDCDQLEENKEYEVVLTNKAGLYRYTNGDIIKVLGYRNDCPLITFSKRKDSLLNIAGDKTTEKHFEMALEEIEKQFNINFSNWVAFEDASIVPHRYTVLVETQDKFDLTLASDMLHKLLCKYNNMYETVGHDISTSKIALQKLGTHEKWRQKKIDRGASPNVVKPVHIINKEMQIEFFTNPDFILDNTK